MIKIYTVIFFLSFLHTICSQESACQLSSPKYEKKFTKALSEKDPLKRQDKLGKVIIDFPEFPKTYFFLAEITNRNAQNTYKQGNQKEAFKLQSKANLLYQATIKNVSITMRVAILIYLKIYYQWVSLSKQYPTLRNT